MLGLVLTPWVVVYKPHLVKTLFAASVLQATGILQTTTILGVP